MVEVLEVLKECVRWQILLGDEEVCGREGNSYLEENEEYSEECCLQEGVSYSLSCRGKWCLLKSSFFLVPEILIQTVTSFGLSLVFSEAGMGVVL